MRVVFALLCAVAAATLSENLTDRIPAQDFERAKEVADLYFVEADMSYEERKLDEALPFYRAAARLCPHIASYVLRVALVEYQMSKFEEAYLHFIQVLKADPANADARFYTQKMKDERGFCLEDGCPTDWEDVTELKPILELEPTEVFTPNGEGPFQFPDFTKHSVHPFVIRNAAQNLGGDLSVFDTDSLRQSYGDQPVDFYPQNMLIKPKKVYNVPFSKALDYLSFPEGAYLSVDASSPGTYIQWSVNETTWDKLLDKSGLSKLPRVLTHSLDSLLVREHTESLVASAAGDAIDDDIDHVPAEAQPQRPAEFDDVKSSFGHKTHWYMVLIGEAGSGMFAHQDTLAVGSWQVQVSGSKNWRLCSPTPPFEPDIPDPTPPAMGTEEGQVCYETVLHTGDVIFYPPYYWHETINLETPSVSLSGTVVLDSEVHPDVGDHVPAGSSSNYREALISSLRTECEEDGKGFDLDDELCDFFV